MTTITRHLPALACLLRWPKLGKAPGRRGRDAGEVLEEFRLPGTGRSGLNSSQAGSGAAAPAGLPPFITSQGRDLRIDLLRGYFVFAMIVDHVRGASPLQLLTGGNRFFAGAAEGFILTSGLVAGLVYGRLIGRDGMGRSFVKVLQRTLTLYLLTLALTLVLLPLSELLYLPWAQGVDVSDPVSVVVSILTLHRTYYLVDVMLLYTVLFLLTPLALTLIDQGKRWWVLGGAWLLWGVFQLWPDYATLPWPIAGNYLFSFSAWQVIFFSGLVLGHGRMAMPVPRPSTTRLLLVVTGALFLALIVLFAVVEPPTSLASGPLALTSSAGHDLRVFVENFFLDKVDERPGRLLAAAITFGFLFLAVTRFWRPVQRAFGWLLMPLGQHALYAYTVHVGLVALVAVGLAPFKLGSPGPWWLNVIVQAASVVLIWLLIRFRVLAPTTRTQRYYNLTPILLTGLALLAFRLDPSPQYPGLTEPTIVAAALPGSRPVSRFGTPLPPDAVKSRATPTPTGASTGLALQSTQPRPTTRTAGPTPTRTDGGTPPAPTPTAGPTATAVPTQTPEVKPTDPAEAWARVEPWVGTIEGALEEHWFYSDALGRDMPYWAYLPPDYDTAGRRYPVVYLLHGLGGHRDEWINYGVVEVADREMSHGVMTPMIIIMPQGDRGYWLNNVGDGPRWGDYVTQDLIAQVDTTFRTRREPAARAIGGLSMGGFGALTLAFTHLNTFSVVGAHSPSLRPDDGELSFLGTGDAFAERDPVALADSTPALDRLRIWIDIGEADPWLDRGQQLHAILDRHSIAHIWQVFPGAHDWDYWTTHVIDYLHFYGDALARQ